MTDGVPQSLFSLPIGRLCPEQILKEKYQHLGHLEQHNRKPKRDHATSFENGSHNARLTRERKKNNPVLQL